MKKLILSLLISSLIGLSPIFLYLLGIVEGGIGCDYTTQLIPFIIEAKRMFLSGAPFWSWNSFFGDNFIGAYSYYVVGNPFAWLCMLFPVKHIAWVSIFSLVIQYILYGITSFLYFKRMNFEEPICRLGAMMYALASFSIIAMYYYIFAIGIIFFPLLLICIENLIDKERNAFVKLSLLGGFFIVSNYYIAAISFIGGFLYICARLYSEGRCDRTVVLCKFIGAIILSIAISAIIFVPTILCALGSARNTFGHIETKVTSMFVSFMMKLFYMVVPRATEGKNVLYPAFASFSLYIPVIGYCLTACYCMKNKKSWLTRFLFVMLFIILTPINIIFSLGANELYGRAGYMVVLLAILASLYAIKDNLISKNRIVRYIKVVIIIVVIDIIYFSVFTKKDLFSYYFGSELFLFAISLVLLYLYGGKRDRVLYWSVIFIGTINILTYSIFLINNGKSLSFNIFNSEINYTQDNIFKHRSDIQNLSHNDISMCNAGLSANIAIPRYFHSVFNKNIMDFRNSYVPSTNPDFSTPKYCNSFYSLLSVKNLFDVEDPLVVKNNPLYLPMGFAYDSYILETILKKELDTNKQTKVLWNEDEIAYSMLQNLVIGNADEKELGEYLKCVNSTDYQLPLDSVIATRRRYVASEFLGNTEGGTAIINNPVKTRVYFFSIPHDPGFNAILDGQRKIKIYRANLGFSAVVIPPGIHKLEFKYIPPGLKLGLIISGCASILLLALYIIDKHRCNKK